MNTPGSRQISRNQQYMLILLLSLATLPHALNLERLVSGMFFIMVAYRLLAMKIPALLPGRILLFLATLLALGNVYIHYPLLFGRDGGVALLASMVALKLMEMRSQRDIYVLVFIGYFMLATQFLFRDQTLLLVYVLLLVAALTALLVEINRADPPQHPLQPLKVALSLLAQAVPIMVALFIFFPRFSSPLWNIGPQSGQAVTGISGRISPGNISRLSRSSAVAFRVDFEGEVPSPAQRYWRGPVFTTTDGESWLAAEAAEGPGAAPIAGRPSVSYSVTMEPAPGHWLFALELPSQIPSNSRLLADYQLVRDRPVARRIRYRASSVLEHKISSISERQRQSALELPPNVSGRMRALVASWQAANSSPVEIIAAALDYFKTLPFYYTLYPPEPGINATDGFLFDTRRGFCEHYATSFTLLMRIAGIPARVVGGYQGGEFNPIGNYLIVRQSDAHAWSEVWLNGEGWTRIDPTAAVAPERLERPLDLAQISQLVGAPALFQGLGLTLPGQILKSLGLGLDALNAAWYRWVLGYSKEQQSRLMSRVGLGFLNESRLAYAMVIAAGILILMMVALELKRSRRPVDPVYAAYRRFCGRLGRRGLERLPHEGPKDYAERVVRQRPDLSPEVTAITRLYIGIRYGRQDGKQQRRRLNRLINAFRPG